MAGNGIPTRTSVLGLNEDLQRLRRYILGNTALNWKCHNNEDVITYYIYSLSSLYPLISPFDTYRALHCLLDKIKYISTVSKWVFMCDSMCVGVVD